MALGLRHWIGGTLAACAFVAVALLPPKEDPRRERFRSRAVEVEEAQVPARARAQRLARTANSVQEHYLLLRLRDSVLAVVERTRPGMDSGLLLLFDRRLPTRLPEVVTPPIERVWTETAPHRGDIRTVVAVVVDTAPGPPGLLRRGLGRSITQVVPTVIDGRTCLVLVRLGRFDLRNMDDSSQLTATTVLGWYARREGLPRILGLCAYYAAFGAPGRHMRQWLESTDFVLTQTPDWAPRKLEPPATPPERPGPLWPWSRPAFRAAAPVSLPACAAGNPTFCRASVFNGFLGSRSATRFAGVVRAWWGGGGAVDLYLADLVADMGRDRFVTFWRSEAPVETAFEEAFGTTLERWTQRWARSHVGVWPAGPAPSLVSAMVSLVALGIVVAGGAFYATRRQVR